MTHFDVASFSTERETQEVVEKFESCAYAAEEFVHGFHIAVAVVYLVESGLEMGSAMRKMRAALLRFSAHHKKMGYSETITRFWLLLVNEFLLAQPAGLPLFELANRARTRFDDKSLLFEYYSRERVLSDEAKQQWLEPDLKPLHDWFLLS